MTTLITLSKYFIFACIFTAVFAKPKSVIYWGQESDGKEKPLRNYCSSGNYDIIVMGFAYEFPTTSGSDYPALNFASHCETPHDAANPQLLICPGIAADITYCQSLGVEIMLSFGGGVGRYGFTSDAQAVTFATLVWNMFMEGSHPIRPFGTALIDGVDLDIEGGGTTGYVAFINKLRSYFATSQRHYSISSAPQCFYPDGRLGPGAGTALGGAWMDYVFVQFYNNYCGLEFTPYLSTPQFNFNVWANWARTGSVNPNVKVFIGAPAAKRAVGAGYVTIDKLQAYAAGALATYSDVYGGIMLWDASNSDNNGNFGALVSAFIKSQSGATPVVQTPASTPVTTAAPAPVVPSTTAKVVATMPAPAPVTTAAMPTPAPVTTAAKVVATMPAPTPVTTAAMPTPAPVTTAAKVSAPVPTPVPLQTSTPVQDPTPVTTAAMPMPTPAPVASTGRLPTTQPTSSTTTCNAGNMKCLTSETYSMCDHGKWNIAQSCQQGLTCQPNGNYIYCVRPK